MTFTIDLLDAGISLVTVLVLVICYFCLTEGIVRQEILNLVDLLDKGDWKIYSMDGINTISLYKGCCTLNLAIKDKDIIFTYLDNGNVTPSVNIKDLTCNRTEYKLLKNKVVTLLNLLTKRRITYNKNSLFAKVNNMR